ncbi:MAG: phosphoenolpyruvate--protein phosphotransferase [Tissierellales bacterium]|nr:phosphoenolpyruvate--protein phosphotransferase [Tissierellales bacterium]
MKGKRVYGGIAIGRAFLVMDVKIENVIKKENIDINKLETEIDRFELAHKKTIQDIEKLKEHALNTIGTSEAEIFEAHLDMVKDPFFIESIIKKIKNNLINAEYAVLEARNEILKTFNNMQDEYLKARANDILDVTDTLLKNLMGIENQNIANISTEAIVVAKDLKPSQTIQLNNYVKGIILEEGSVTSHAAIVAKAKGIPTLVGVEGALDKIKNNSLIVMDCEKEKIIIDPSKEELEYYTKIEAKQTEEKVRLSKYKNKKCLTKDGFEIKIFGNVGSIEEAKLVKENGGFGIGLLRTELIYMNSKHFPTEEEQYNYYSEIVKIIPDEVIIRTLDIGGDKMLPYYKFPEEMNPFLGLRAIRFCLKNKDIFKTQLRAILRASAFGKVKIMLPMVSNLEEIIESKKIIEEAKKELKNEHIKFDEDIEVGIMIEIPAAAISADILAKEVDFFSIGTNDLIQYSCAVDRMNKNVSYLYDPYHPSVLRLIKMTIDAAKNNNIEVGVCGETAGDPDFSIILAGMGADELSMSASMIPYIKDTIARYNRNELEKITSNVMNQSDSKSAYEALIGGKNAN